MFKGELFRWLLMYNKSNIKQCILRCTDRLTCLVTTVRLQAACFTSCRVVHMSDEASSCIQLCVLCVHISRSAVSEHEFVLC